MRGLILSSVLVPVLLLGACAAQPPTGPTVLAVPGKNKTFAQFQQDEATCRNYAQAQIGPTTPAQAGAQSAIGSAAVGTAVGAAAGALLGSVSGNVGAGAAIGAGSGLLLGSAVGAGNAQASSAALQQRYDFGYIQCMTANGEDVQAAPAAYPVAAYPAYPAYAYGYPAYAYPPVAIGIGVGGYYGPHGYWGPGGYWRRY